MDKNQFREIFFKLNIEEEKWTTLNEIDSIELSNGIGIYPNWKHIRFLFVKDQLLIQHGHSKPYGARLNLTFNPSYDFMSFSFPPHQVVPDTEYYKKFREPEIGDILRASNGFKILDEVTIDEIQKGLNGFRIHVSRQMKLIGNTNFRLSFYDPMSITPNSIHATESEGIYMNFITNDGKKNKSYRIIHETISCKQIKKINLKVGSPYYGKVYPIEEKQ